MNDLEYAGGGYFREKGEGKQRIYHAPELIKEMQTRIQELEEALKEKCIEADTLRQHFKVAEELGGEYRKALEFYADENNWKLLEPPDQELTAIDVDEGAIACEALNGQESQHPLQDLADKMKTADHEAEKIFEDNCWDLVGDKEN